MQKSDLEYCHAKRQYVYKSDNTLGQPDEHTATHRQDANTELFKYM